MRQRRLRFLPCSRVPPRHLPERFIDGLEFIGRGVIHAGAPRLYFTSKFDQLFLILGRPGLNLFQQLFGGGYHAILTR
jgi:hypothetical protein